ncbi:TonB-dependent receptor [Salinisphaera sp. PC39]|uniref:TonB-dependent receptor n=1 Tax=Salinisphaera sp. PC39 TaxID=1304156 RepID=UPI00333ED6FB
MAQTASGEQTYEEFVVTAQKREERLLDVPMSIEAFSGEEMEERGIDTVEDLSFAVPGLTTRSDGPGSYTIFMRGVANQYGGGATVSTYMDEAPLTLTGYDQLYFPTMDLERVEVLKGPQGTLYGQGSVSGTIRYITKDPVLNVFEGSLKGALSTVDEGNTKREFTGIMNIPIVQDVAALRIAANVQDGGGWIDQPEAGIEDGNEADQTSFRIKGLWQATDLLTLEAMILRHRSETRLGQGFEQPDRTNFVAIDPSMTLVPKEYDYDLYNLEATYDFGFAELLSATTYVEHDHQYPFAYQSSGPDMRGYAGSDYEGNDARWVEADQFTQELRLTSTGFGPWKWTIGAYYSDSEKTLDALSDYVYFAFGPPVYGAPYHSEQESKQSSVFANASYDLTDRLEVGAGVRYFRDERDEFYRETGVDEEETFDSVDPRIFASYAITDSANVYASIARGFRSGGVNSGDGQVYDPESLISYELGTKASVLDGAVDFELAVFFSQYDDMLRRGLVPTPGSGSGTTQTTSNIGEAEIKGIEGGVTWRPLDGLALNATFAATDAEVTHVDRQDQAQDGDLTSLEGDPIDYVPDFSLTLGAQYDFYWADSIPGFARVDYSYRDKVPYTDRTAFFSHAVPQYSDIVRLLDARIGLTYGRATYELFGTNLTNENVYIDPYHAWENANRTRPRAVGVSAKYDFQ